MISGDVLINWSFSSQSIYGKFLFLPLKLASGSPEFFLGTNIVIFTLLLFLRPGYLTNILFCWIIVNLFRLKFPVINGSDFVLLVFSIFNMAFVSKNETGNSAWLRALFFNTFRYIAQFQVVLIYLISGIDKLENEHWRSGEIFKLVMNYESMFNPWYIRFLEIPELRWSIAWVTILFELLFFILVKIKRTRLLILCVGILFHILIATMLALPDFAFVMIVTYFLFLDDADWKRICQFFRLNEPSTGLLSR